VPRKLSRMKRLLTSSGVVVAALAAAPAVADACEFGPTSQAFAPFGDGNDYYLAPGGDFESLTWSSWGEPSLVSDVNPFALAGGTRSLKLEAGEGVTSPEMCVSRKTPHLRFVAKGAGTLMVSVRMRAPGRMTSVSFTMSPTYHAEWAASKIVKLWTSGLGENETGLATVSFRSYGEWLIDDVFVDPYRR
jgi:hypothetical protein